MPTLSYTQNGHSLVISGVSYGANEVVQLCIIGPNYVYTLPGGVSTDASGKFSGVNVGIPSDQKGEFYIVGSGLTSKKSDVTSKFVLT